MWSDYWRMKSTAVPGHCTEVPFSSEYGKLFESKECTNRRTCPSRYRWYYVHGRNSHVLQRTAQRREITVTGKSLSDTTGSFKVFESSYERGLPFADNPPLTSAYCTVRVHGFIAHSPQPFICFTYVFNKNAFKEGDQRNKRDQHGMCEISDWTPPPTTPNQHTHQPEGT